MEDRAVLYPGRIKLVPVEGQENVYDKERADEPFTEGTPLHKQTLLRDETAALFGLDETAVPDDVFQNIGQYNLYHWTKTVDESGWTEVRTPQTKEVVYATYLTIGSVYYADSISIDIAGNITLVSPTSNPHGTTGTAEDAVQIGQSLLGKYVSITVNNKTTFYYVSSDAVLYGAYYGKDDDGWPMYAGQITSGAYVLSTQYVAAQESIVLRSSDRNAYPDNGTVDGAMYQYLGVPFKNLPTAAKIQTGYYLGDGTVGSGHPNSLSFEFIPKLVIVAREDGAGSMMIALHGMTSAMSALGTTNSTYVMRLTWDDKTLSWYANASGSDAQLNYSGGKYYWLAIG